MNFSKIKTKRLYPCRKCGKRPVIVKKKDGYYEGYYDLYDPGCDWVCGSSSRPIGANDSLLKFWQMDNKPRRVSAWAKPCPFCGGRPTKEYWPDPELHDYVCCNNDCEVPFNGSNYSRKDTALMYWNTRHKVKIIDGIATCPFCGKLPSYDKSTGWICCENPECKIQPGFSKKYVFWAEEKPKGYFINQWNKCYKEEE